MAALEGVQACNIYIYKYGTRGSSWYNALCIPCPLFLVRKQDMWWRNMSGFVWCVAQIRQLLALQVVTLRNRRLPEWFMGSAIVSDLARTTAPRLNLYNSFKHDCRIPGRTVDYSNIYCSDCNYLNGIDVMEIHLICLLSNPFTPPHILFAVASATAGSSESAAICDLLVSTKILRPRTA